MSSHGRMGEPIVDYLAKQNIPLFSPLNVNRLVEELESVTLVSDAVSPDEQLEQRDAAECIRHLIAQLPALQQTIIRMKDVEGYELAEIAEITATPVENVRVNLSRARKKIREQFLQLNKQEKWT